MNSPDFSTDCSDPGISLCWLQSLNGLSSLYNEYYIEFVNKRKKNLSRKKKIFLDKNGIMEGHLNERNGINTHSP